MKVRNCSLIYWIDGAWLPAGRMQHFLGYFESIKQPSQMMDDENIREVTVQFAGKNKLLALDFGNFEETTTRIRRKFNISGAFELQVSQGEKNTVYSIEDDDDLARFGKRDMFLVTLVHGPPPGIQATEGAAFSPPPSYDQSLKETLPKVG